MRKPLPVFVLVLILFIPGCAGQYGFFKPSPSVRSHLLFTKQGSGETVLYLDGEDWYGLINLKGFTDIDMGLDNIDQFLWRGNKGNITIKIFAEKTDSSKDSDSCLKSFYNRMPYKRTTQVEYREIYGKKTMVHTSGGRKYIDYCPYNKGYCFNFHIAMKENADESAIKGILDSIAFVDDSSIKVQLAKIFKVYDKLIQIGVPDTWKPHYRFEFLSVPAIIYTPPEGNNFHIYLSPLWSLEKSNYSEDDISNLAKKKMYRWLDRSSTELTLQELRGKNFTMIYFDATDSYYNPGDTDKYPFVRQGCVLLDGYAFSFTIEYQEEGRGDAQTGTEAIAHAKMLDFESVPTLTLP